jgi:intron-binding protein aquarius
LELSGYLENYLWTHFTEDSCFEHTFSILMMVNEKFREGVPVFEALTLDPVKFQTFFKAVVSIADIFNVSLCAQENEQLVRQYVIYIHFLVNTFRSLEDPVVRSSTLRYFSLPLWGNLSEARLTEELDKFPQIKRHWQHLQNQAKIAAENVPESAPSSSSKSRESSLPISSPPGKGQAKKKSKKNEAAAAKPSNPEPVVEAPVGVPPKAIDVTDRTWVFGLLTVYLQTVEDASSKSSNELKSKAFTPVMRYLERFSEFIVDLLSQLPTRRFLNTLLDDMHVLVRCRRASIITQPEGKLLSQLLTMIDACMRFEVHDQTGRALTPHDMMTVQNTRINRLQTLAFSHYNSILKDLVFSSTGELAKPETLKKHFQSLTTQQLTDVASRLGRLSESDLAAFGGLPVVSEPMEEVLAKSSVTLLSPAEFLEDTPLRSFVVDVLVDSLSARRSQLEALNRLSLYPSEELLWDQYQVPVGNTFTSDRPLALPKLNLQFLTVHDYLLRNFELFRLESAFEIREDLIDAVRRMGPRSGLKGNTVFGGWARMAQAVASVSIDEVTLAILANLSHCT